MERGRLCSWVAAVIGLGVGLGVPWPAWAQVVVPPNQQPNRQIRGSDSPRPRHSTQCGRRFGR